MSRSRQKGTRAVLFAIALVWFAVMCSVEWVYDTDNPGVWAVLSASGLAVVLAFPAWMAKVLP